MNTPIPIPYGEAFEQLREALEALRPELQPVFLDWLYACKDDPALVKELTHATGIPLDMTDVGHLRREMLSSDRKHDHVQALRADAALTEMGHGLDVSEMLVELKKLMPIACAMRWIPPGAPEC